MGYGLWGAEQFARNINWNGVAKVSHIAGQATFIAGAAISTAQLISNPSLSNGFYAAMDVAYGYVGTYGGPPGWIAAGYYNGIKYTIGWDKLGDAITKSTIAISNYNETQPNTNKYIPLGY